MKARLLLVLTVASIAFSCKKKDNSTPTPNNPTNPAVQQKCIPQEIEFVAELGTNGTTHWADSFVYDGSGQLTKVVHKHSPWGIYYDFTYNNGKIVKIDRYENTGLQYTDSVFWNANGYVERVKVYQPKLYKDIKFSYSGQKLTKREIYYYSTTNSYLSQDYSYNTDGTLSKSEVFYPSSGQFYESYVYKYNSSSLFNKSFNAGKKELMDIHWNIDDWEMSVYDIFNYSPKVPTTIEHQEVGSPLETYTMTVDTNSNGYVTKLKSDGHDVVNLTYQCK